MMTATTQFNASTFDATKPYLGGMDQIRPQRLYDHYSISSSIKKEPLPSIWNSGILALPFDDQKWGRRELSTCGRSYATRAGIFSSEQQQKQQQEQQMKERKDNQAETMSTASHKHIMDSDLY